MESAIAANVFRLPPMKMAPASLRKVETGPHYWRSLDELQNTPEFRAFVEREFPGGATELADPVTRRHFMKIMSASFLLAGFGLTGCRRPVSCILPFSKQPEGYLHGLPQYYATAMPTRCGTLPLLVKSNDGRPTKVEGNPLLPGSNGATDRFAQASVLDLYDPDRAQQFKRSGASVTRQALVDFLASLSREAEANRGQGLCFLMEASTSPSRARLQQCLVRRFPRARWFLHEPIGFGIHREAATLAFSQPVRPFHRLDRAQRIVALDCDFIGAEDDSHRLIRDFARGRKIQSLDRQRGEDLLNRLYVVESLMTLTGMNADHRLRVSPSAVLPIAAALCAQITTSDRTKWAPALERFLTPEVLNPSWIAECAKDLMAHAGRSVVLTGHRQPMAVHLLGHIMNTALGNVGETVVFHHTPVPQEGTLQDLSRALAAGEVKTLMILGGNPAYTAPADLDWAHIQRMAGLVVRLGYYEDETSAACDWHIPQPHYLESWGDAFCSDGTFVSLQPLIAPLFDGISEVELLAHLAGVEKQDGYEIVRETFANLTGGNEQDWKRFLFNGFREGTVARASEVKLDEAAVKRALAAAEFAPTQNTKLEVVFHQDYRIDDGRFNNNGWLQELPDPVTNVTWENVVLLSPKTAEHLGLKPRMEETGTTYAPLVKVRLAGREIIGPAWPQPGMADNTIGLSLGYGRQRSGRVGNGAGYDAYLLRTSKAAHHAAGAEIQPLGTSHPVSTVQHHWSMEGRPVVREANLGQYLDNPTFAQTLRPEPPPTSQSLYPNPFDQLKAKGVHQWGMAIDLNACVGCSVCVLACQSENNIPIVGKDQVGRSREMHWLRIDRYYTGSLADPQVALQPVPCQHCEAAPCENVCPVNATSHDEEGLNLMVYNRCVGTRYCSNNCPYKVRRFNFLDYNRRPLDQLKGPFYSSPLAHATDGQWDFARWWRDPYSSIRPAEEWEWLKLVKNPDVTVRMRGVMEKCTYCIQRIQAAEIAQKVKARDSGDIVVPDGTIKTACQQACPAEAIVFGNIGDPGSRVSQLKAQSRNYSLLDSLGTKPRTTYLARVRNPNPRMPDYHAKPFSWQEHARRNDEPLQPGPGDGSPAEPGGGSQ